MTKRKRRKHLAWRGGALCGQRYPKPDITGNPRESNCLNCYKTAGTLLRTTHRFGFTTESEKLADERGYLSDAVHNL